MEIIAAANTYLLFGAVLVLLGILSSLIATRFGAPLLLIFLVIGMLAGEDGPGGIVFSDFRLTYMVGAFALAVILFDGGLRTKLANQRGLAIPSTVLATFGVVVTAGVVAGAAMLLLKMNFLPAFLLGAVVASTDAAAVFFLIHTGGLELKRRVSATLEMESGTNDPVAVLLALIVVEVMLAGGEIGVVKILTTLAHQTIVGAALGIGGGFALSVTINRLDLPGGMHPLFAISAAVVIFALTSTLGGSGFLAAYLAGLVLGNRPLRASASIVTVNDAVTWLCQIAMFLVLGLLVTPSRMIDYALPAAIISAVLMFVARPLAVWLSLWPFKFTTREKTFVSWVGLRGAVSIFLAAVPMLSGVPNAELYFNIAFFVVLISLVLQGWTINTAAQWLGLALPRKTATVHRFELDLPGQLKSEMVGYPVHADSAILMGGRVPDWARLMLVVREERTLDPAEAGSLKDGDYAYFLAPPERAERLDRLFASIADHGLVDPAFFGEFSFTGDVGMNELATFYGLTPPPGLETATVAEVFANKFDDRPQVGDQLRLGDAALVAQELDGDRVKRAGLHLETDGTGAIPLQVIPLWRRLTQTLRDLLKKQSRPG